MPLDRRGAYIAAASYVLWGIMPIYLHALREVDGLEVLASRVVFSWAFLFGIRALFGGFGFLRALGDAAVARRFLVSALLVSLNWFLYIGAVASDRGVDASLGYFINPLVSVALGAWVLRERLRPGQWAAVATAAAGVLYLTLQAGQVPWIGLSLAVSFALYGLARKTAPLGAIDGLAAETTLLLPLALAGFAWFAFHGESALVAGPWTRRWLLAAAGPVTAVPLVLFAEGARRIPLSLLGLLQYVGPSLQMAVGVYLFGERVSSARLVGFAIVWSALVVYSAEGFLHARRAQTAG